MVGERVLYQRLGDRSAVHEELAFYTPTAWMRLRPRGGRWVFQHVSFALCFYLHLSNRQQIPCGAEDRRVLSVGRRGAIRNRAGSPQDARIDLRATSEALLISRSEMRDNKIPLGGRASIPGPRTSNNAH